MKPSYFKIQCQYLIKKTTFKDSHSLLINLSLLILKINSIQLLIAPSEMINVCLKLWSKRHVWIFYCIILEYVIRICIKIKLMVNINLLLYPEASIKMLVKPKHGQHQTSSWCNFYVFFSCVQDSCFGSIAGYGLKRAQLHRPAFTHLDCGTVFSGKEQYKGKTFTYHLFCPLLYLATDVSVGGTCQSKIHINAGIPSLMLPRAGVQNVQPTESFGVALPRPPGYLGQQDETVTWPL